MFPGFCVSGDQRGGPELLARLERRIEVADPFSPEANRMSLLVHGGGVFMRLDQEGRLMVTDFIRNFTGITDHVAFVGRGIISSCGSGGVGDCAKVAREGLGR